MAHNFVQASIPSFPRDMMGNVGSIVLIALKAAFTSYSAL